jgi:hypothetical protein
MRKAAAAPMAERADFPASGLTKGRRNIMIHAIVDKICREVRVGADISRTIFPITERFAQVCDVKPQAALADGDVGPT